MSTPSPLPRAMQALRANELAAAAAQSAGNGGEPPAPAGTVVPAPTPGATPSVAPQPGSDTGAPAATELPPAPEERITLSRAEYNELQASKAATSRLEAAQLRIEELQHRLTELEKASKGSGDPASGPAPAPAAPLVEMGEIQFTEDEEKDFGESRSFVEKVAKQVMAGVLPAIEQRLAKLEQGIQTAQQGVSRVAHMTFQERVMQAVPDLGALIAHKHWGDFLDTREEFSGQTFEDVLAMSLRDQSVERAKRVYDEFRRRFVGQNDGKEASTIAAAYAGATPSGASGKEPPAAPSEQKYKLSDRKRVSEDYRKGRISWEEKEAFDKKFMEADAKGLVDYDA